MSPQPPDPTRVPDPDSITERAPDGAVGTGSTSVPAARRFRRAAGRLLAVAGIVMAVAAAAVVPAAALLTGVDVASHQHPNGQPIEWRQVRAAGHTYAFVKATEGTTYTNPWFRRDFDGAGAAGLYRGAYHYARPSLPLSSAVAQARYMVSVTGTLRGAGELPLVLDLEETGGLGPADLAAWARAFLAEARALTGRAPIIYTGFYFWRDSVGAPADLAANHRLWLPSYPADPHSTTFRPLVPAGFPTWTFWQYTSTGSVPGIVGNVDINRFCCDAGTLAGLAGGGGSGGNPFGSLDQVRRLPGAASVAGWLIDPDTRGPARVHLYVDGQWAGEVLGDRDRPDVGAAYPGFGAAHGFSTTVNVGSGSRQLCAYAINEGPGDANPLLGCASLVANPVGNHEASVVDGNGAVVVSGWALDADAAQPVDIHVYVDGQWGTGVTTSVERLDVQGAYPGSGPRQGFRASLPSLPPGRRTVCAYAINIGSGTTNPLLGCRVVEVPPVNPIGAVNGASTGLGTVRLTGWALDFNTPNPLVLHAYLDGAWAGSFRAETSRPDVGAYLGVGPDHGFDVTLASPTGTHTACLYGINVGAGTTNTLLGCRTLTVGADPTGSIDFVGRVGDRATMSGWAIDPDTNRPIDLHFYVDGQWGGLVTAAATRVDVGDAFPAFGAAHGYTAEFLLAPGPRRICAYAINVGPGGHTLLGCRVV